LKKAEIEIDSRSYRNDKENPYRVLHNHSGIITPNKLQVEAVRGSVKILKRVLGMRL